MDLEALLVQEGVAAPPRAIRRVLLSARRDGLNPVAALVDEGIVVEDVLAEVLARACGTVVVDLERHTIDDEAALIVPADLARERLLMAVTEPSEGKLRVVFANPFDDDSASEVEQSAGVRVVRLVGTVSGVRQAIQRVYSARTTQVVRSRAEMPPEITRRVRAPTDDEEGDALVGTDTAQLHRLERSATMEQRHEALLLALIEKGVLTRADYAEALERLVSGRRSE